MDLTLCRGTKIWGVKMVLYQGVKPNQRRYLVARVSEKEAKKLNVQSLPPGEQYVIWRMSVEFTIYTNTEDCGSHHCESLGELRRFIPKLRWAEQNPNTARLRRIEQNLTFYNRQWRETEEAVRDGRGHVLRFFWNGKKKHFQSVKWANQTVAIYTPGEGGEYHADLVDGKAIYCTVQKVAVCHKPTATRHGFKLILVALLHEHFDPATEIARLRSEIAAGKP